MTTATLPFAPAASSGTLQKSSELAGRILLAAIFLISGLGKIGTYSAIAGYMASLGVPGALLPAVIALEVAGAIAIIVGWQTRVTAFLLAGFTLLSAVLFHNNLGDQVQSIMFLKNVAIAGGFLILVAHGAGPLSVDRIRQDRRASNGARNRA
jgi:putative oxidoreductase